MARHGERNVKQDFPQRTQRTQSGKPQTEHRAAFYDADDLREECPHEWGHGSLEGYATVLLRLCEILFFLTPLE